MTRFTLLTVVACSWAALGVASAGLRADAFAWQSSDSVSGAALVATTEQRLPKAKPAPSDVELRPLDQSGQSVPAAPAIEPPTLAPVQAETPRASLPPRATEATVTTPTGPPPSAPKDALDVTANRQSSQSGKPPEPVATR